ncbi:MAG: sigma-54 factor interaction domain-containing protein, partial [Gammaproteobacteria bacterium]|nr:sigma-54 factor interaction domain-containing protein [Gammaproteobacteria bacterium]
MKTSLILNLQDIVDSYEEPAVLVSDKYVIIKANMAYLELYNLDGHCHHSSSSGSISAEVSTDNMISNEIKLLKKHHCYEVSHQYSHSCDKEGESCPLQLAKSTLMNQRVLHVHHTRYGEEHVDVSLSPIRGGDGQLYFLEVMKTIKHASPKSVQKGMVGKSPSFNKLLSLINRVAEYDISVLLQGASGSGKELVAHAVHQASLRHSMACVTVECSGLSESLFESELFGHEKGSFTGAVNKKKGLVEEAEGGTL